MRTIRLPVLTAIAALALLLTPDFDHGQPPPPNPKPKSTKPPPDEFKALVKEVEEAYEAPFEVDEDIRDELRKQYKNPTPEREAKIFREIRKLYNTTPEQEQDILRELRAAYQRPSPEQEAKIFAAIRRNGQLPPGTVPIEVQASRAEKLFRSFDRDSDGRLSSEEAPDTLRAMWQRWDRNGDGFITFDEYGVYFQAHLRSVSDRVASGEIAIKLPRGATLPSQSPLKNFPSSGMPQMPNRNSPPTTEPVAIRFGKLPPGLPEWFTTFDTDRDGQIGLYEWRAERRPVEEFTELDRNGDFLITPEEMLRYLTEKAKAQPSGQKR
ncbi:MAG: hypothetical protein L0241_03870 [Planctomycetia bacterium]|nr:hypothetical protein [Planctomycetia bacterium]